MKIFSLVLLVLSIALASCEKNNEVGKEYTTEPIEDVNAILMLWQDSSSLDLVLRSPETHKCGSAYMVSESNNTNTSYSIYLKEIVVPQICIDTNGWPRAIIEFPKLANGEYPLAIKVGNKTKNNGKLYVTDRKYEIKMETEYGLHFPNGRVLEH